MVRNSRVEGVEERINFEVARNRKFSTEDYDELRWKGIDGDDNNYPAPKNITQINNTTTTATRTDETALNWTGAEGIVCPLLASNLPLSPACFKNYYNKDIMNMSKHDFS